MGSQQRRLQPTVEHLDGATRITLTGPKRSGEDVVAKELKGLTGGLGQTHLVLDFARVPYITSVELATLIRLHKKMKGSGGRLTLTNVSPEVYEVFVITRLHTVLDVRQGDRAEALV